MLPDSPNDHIPGYNAAFSQGRVIVIGAGFAGLSAAQLLKTKRYDVTVWEASDRLGDQVISCPVKDLSLRRQGAGGERVFRFLHRCKNHN
ncbi:MAG: FAD-dependent oxidoreductase [Nostoc sp.]|uniref:FAD-dependent oxidoreductase n=1 Tax=Nostoc sp. TaxID=1180 RepID=UPI002FF81C10